MRGSSKLTLTQVVQYKGLTNGICVTVIVCVEFYSTSHNNDVTDMV